MNICCRISLLFEIKNDDENIIVVEYSILYNDDEYRLVNEISISASDLNGVNENYLKLKEQQKN